MPLPKPRIQFLSFDGCPLAAATRARLERALSHCGLQPDNYEAVDLLNPSTPEHLARWGSPTILVEGRDVAGEVGGDGVGCRIYNTTDRLPGVESITAAICEHIKSPRKSSG